VDTLARRLVEKGVSYNGIIIQIDEELRPDLRAVVNLMRRDLSSRK
jgi:hypothetical protein